MERREAWRRRGKKLVSAVSPLALVRELASLVARSRRRIPERRARESSEASLSIGEREEETGRSRRRRRRRSISLSLVRPLLTFLDLVVGPAGPSLEFEAGCSRLHVSSGPRRDGERGRREVSFRTTGEFFFSNQRGENEESERIFSSLHLRPLPLSDLGEREGLSQLPPLTKRCGSNRARSREPT